MDGIELLIYLGTKIVACQKERGGGGVNQRMALL